MLDIKRASKIMFLKFNVNLKQIFHKLYFIKKKYLFIYSFIYLFIYFNYTCTYSNIIVKMNTLIRF